MRRMRRILTVSLLAAAAACCQTIVDPARLPNALKSFEQGQSGQRVKCEVTPFRPVLNFGFRFQAGYVARVPLNQYPGSGHRLRFVTRITPLGGGRKPTYLFTVVPLPKIPKTKASLEIAGSYLLGEGDYRVEWTLYDEKMRVCHKDWHAGASLGFSERKVKVAMPPGSVADLSLRGASEAGGGVDDARPIRLTVLLHAAPLSPRRTTLRASDKMMLLGTLSTLLERVPSRSLRLVVFNLDQQKEIFRQDGFDRAAFDRVTRSIDELELGAVDYGILKNRRGHVEFLAGLVNRELGADEPSDEVVFLGPPARILDNLPLAALERHGGSGPGFFYLLLKPYFRGRVQTSFPDSINYAVAKLKGKVVEIHTPAEFAKAIDQIESQAGPGK
jgi:hypothetical protein